MKWISVNDKLPKVGEDVIVHCANETITGPILIGCYWDERGGGHEHWSVQDVGDNWDYSVTHWMPKPELPY